MSWEDTFQSWAKPPGETEQAKCDNAERAIRKAIDASSTLSSFRIRVFAQGSYRNRTNVKQDSDVDVCVLRTDVCFTDYSMSDGLTDADVGLTSIPYTYPEFKNEIEKALRIYFGSTSVSRGNKAFDVRENSYRVDADVVPCFEHRRYQRRTDGGSYCLLGTELRHDNGRRVVNWPDQNYANGTSKNESTQHRFKSLVRILKRLRNKMDDERVIQASPIPGYLIECLVWNVPNPGFGHEALTSDVRWALAHLFNNTMRFEDCQDWGEINELKYLLRTSQRWTLEQVHSFVSAAWDYIGFK